MASATVAGFLGACGHGPGTRVVTPAAATRSPRPYLLYTHCGIDDVRIGNRYFVAVHPLSDGQGNPPPGWGNPVQKGTMTLLSPTRAVFHDQNGHQVQFVLRPGARGFRHVCS